MADFFNKKQKADLRRTELSDSERVRRSESKSKTAEEESTADILYPTMRNMKPKTSSFADVLPDNSSSEKKKSGTFTFRKLYAKNELSKCGFCF